VFYVNIPIALLVLAVTPGLMPSVPARRGSIDFAGAITATAGLALTVFGIVRAPDEGWGSATTILTLGGGGVLLAAFLVIQASRPEPLMRLGIFKAPNLAAANVAQFLLGAAWIPMWFFLNLYLQQVLGYGAFEGGAALLPMTAAIMLLMVVVAPRVVNRFGFKTPIVGGMLALAAGMAVMSLVRADGNFAADVLPASLIAAAGMSLAFIPSLGTAISSARPEEGGLASGIVNTSYQVGSALGLAVMTAVATSRGADQLGNLTALTDGYSAAFLGAAGVAVIGALLAAALLRTPKTAAPSPSDNPAETREAVAA
jgi:predicted MFS family arabinose efflux permease